MILWDFMGFHGISWDSFELFGFLGDFQRSSFRIELFFGKLMGFFALIDSLRIL